MKETRNTLRALSLLLQYPDATHRALLPLAAEAIDEEASLPAGRRAEVRALAREIAAADPIEVEARYVELFDRGRSTSLHLFEHVHGDSRDRGPAMIDLIKTYEAAGLELGERELPDHLCVILEFASTQPPAVARSFLGEMAHILKAIFSALRQRDSTYASLVAAVLELAGQKVEAVPFTPDESLDASWEEPAVFGGCSVQGQARPSQPQPIRIVRNTPRHTQEGVRA
jgi:nitrate reductase delta subunit